MDFFLLLVIFVLVIKLYLKLSCGVCRSPNTMEGKVIVVTGANSGIGFETAKNLAARKGRVILACRSMERGTKAADSIISETGNTNVVVRQLDLSSLDSVRKFAALINETEKRLDVLIHNAGVAASPGLHLTKDNLELQFATNYFGPFLLTHLLMDLLKKSAPSRIVVVSSILHFFATLDFDNLNCEKYIRNPLLIYCSTKLANILFVKELTKRLKGSGVTANALHPGAVKTAITRNGQWFLKYLIVPVFYPFLKTSGSGAQTPIYLAVSDDVQNVSGVYFVDCTPTWTSPSARDEAKARRLWKISEQLTGIQKF